MTTKLLQNAIKINRTSLTNKHVKHLLTDTTINEKKSFLNSFDHVLSDCDGVVWSVMGSIKRAGDGINKLKNHGKSVLFVSNNGIRSEASYLEKFSNANIRNITTNVILTPAVTTAHYLKRIKFQGLVYAIGSVEFRSVLKSYGFSVIESSDEPIEETYPAMWNQINDNQPVRAVVLDTDINLNYVKLTKAIKYLKHPDCLFIVGGTETQIPITSDLDILGPGLFYRMIEEVSGRQAIIIGKPGIALKDIVMDKLNTQNSNRVLMIGDTLNQDMEFGRACGFKTLLVLSGTTQLNDLQTMQNRYVPDYYLDSLADLVAVCDDAK